MTGTSMQIDYSTLPFAVRSGFSEEHSRYWERLARPGAWWTGAERVAIAAEVRAAWRCGLCEAKRESLSPASVAGKHDVAGDLLPAHAVDAVHRLVTDANRITKAWLEGLYARGLSDGQYVEIVGTVVAVVSIDSFCLALGAPLHPLPEPVAGDSSRYRPSNLDERTAFVPMLHEDIAGTPEADLWQAGSSANVIRAMSLVPDEVRTLLSLSGAHYLGGASVENPEGSDLIRPQMELVAGRVSALNECFY